MREWRRSSSLRTDRLRKAAVRAPATVAGVLALAACAHRPARRRLRPRGGAGDVRRRVAHRARDLLRHHLRRRGLGGPARLAAAAGRRGAQPRRRCGPSSSEMLGPPRPVPLHADPARTGGQPARTRTRSSAARPVSTCACWAGRLVVTEVDAGGPAARAGVRTRLGGRRRGARLRRRAARPPARSRARPGERSTGSRPRSGASRAEPAQPAARQRRGRGLPRRGGPARHPAPRRRARDRASRSASAACPRRTRGSARERRDRAGRRAGGRDPLQRLDGPADAPDRRGGGQLPHARGDRPRPAREHGGHRAR